MRSNNTSTIFYQPGIMPDDPKLFPRFWAEESLKIQNAINALIAGHLDKSYAAPTKPRDGDFRYADGTTWNPGSGIGFYRYNGTAWVHLG